MTRRLRTYVVAGATAAIVTAANASQGAYFSQSWGWVALAFLVPTTLLVILERATVPGRLRVAFVLFTGTLAAWIALSSLWSVSSAASVREVERMLVYVALALALAFALRRGDGPAVLAGVLVGTTLVSGYALATRLVPDRFETYDDPTLPYRLAEPLGYWNALGLLAGMGALVAVGSVAHARRDRFAVPAAAVVPVLATTFYFTFSRGAWGALAAGFASTVALDPRRLRLLWTALVVLLPTAAAVAIASQQDALTTEDAPVAVAVREGHRLAWVIVALSLASGALAWFARGVSRRVPVGRRGRRALDVVLAAAVVVALAIGVSALGGPREAVSELKDRFEADPVAGADLNSRLFSVSSNGRSELLHVAWDIGSERPIAGSGAGSFEYLWYERRLGAGVVRDAHSLYVEVFGELGGVGLVLLLGMLVVPLVAAVAARRSRLVTVGAGALVMWLAGSAVDWHWEMVGVTLAAFLAGCVGLLRAERGSVRELGPRARLLLAATGVALSVLAVVSLVGNQALLAGQAAVARNDWVDARDHARLAESLVPWSFEPEIVLGDAAAGLGDREAALRSYRDAVDDDPRNWSAWLRLAQVARGEERRAAYARVHDLNPREEDLPGELESSSG